MLDGALLALANQRRTGQDHSDHSEIVDDLHYRGEPTRLQIWIELCACNHPYRCTGQPFAPGGELYYIVEDHVLDVAHPIEGLCGSGGIYIDLNGYLPSGKNVRRELWRNFDNEKEALRIHGPVDFRFCHLPGPLEGRRCQAVRNTS